MLKQILAGSRFVMPHERAYDCRDAKDNEYPELSSASGADFIISEDRDLLDLHGWRGVRIVTPAAYVTDIDARNQPRH